MDHPLALAPMARLLATGATLTVSEWQSLLALWGEAVVSDHGDPSLLDALMLNHGQDPRRGMTWATLLDTLLPRAADPIAPDRWVSWLNTVLERGQNQGVALRLWTEVMSLPSTYAPSSVQIQAWFLTTLQQEWHEMALALLRHGVPTDVSHCTENNHPFCFVNDARVFDAMLTHGFDPMATDIALFTGAARLKARPVSPRQAKAPKKPWRRLNPSPMGAPLVESETRRKIFQSLWQRCGSPPLSEKDFRQLDALLHYVESTPSLDVTFTDFIGYLDTLGEAVWTARFEHGETVLHLLARHRPDWLPLLFRWPGSADIPDAALSAVDDDGVPSLWSRVGDHPPPNLANDQTRDRWLQQNRTEWWDSMAALPTFKRWLSATPALDHPRQAWRHLLITRGRNPIDMECAHPVFWTLNERLGGWSPEAARHAWSTDPAMVDLMKAALTGRSPFFVKKTLCDLSDFVMGARHDKIETSFPTDLSAFAATLWAYRMVEAERSFGFLSQDALIDGVLHRHVDLDLLNWCVTAAIPPTQLPDIDNMPWQTFKVHLERVALTSNIPKALTSSPASKSLPRL